MNKYQEALDRLKINHSDVCQKLNCEVLQELVDKETPKKPKRIYPPFGENVPIKRYPKIFVCPDCVKEVRKEWSYCPYCKKHLDWGNEE
jgi:hypothetical protein